MANRQDLFHYTTLSGFLGIVESREIWLTDFRYLNDITELSLMLNEVAEQLKHEPNRYGTAWDHYLKSWLKFESMGGSFLGVASFSQNDDDLDQWRGYGLGGRGVALRFDRDRLEKLATSKHFELTECVYSVEDMKAHTEAQIAQVPGPGQLGMSSRAEAIQLISGHFASLAARYKHVAFKNENEVRLISPRQGRSSYFDMGSGSPPLQFRPGATTVIPYVTFPIIDDQGSLITGAVVGPTERPDLSKAAVKAALLKLEIHPGDANAVTVCTSSVPYRAIV
jgi:hypothetical protein